jgi:hypothetical protein
MTEDLLPLDETSAHTPPDMKEVLRPDMKIPEVPHPLEEGEEEEEDPLHQDTGAGVQGIQVEDQQRESADDRLVRLQETIRRQVEADIRLLGAAEDSTSGAPEHHRLLTIDSLYKPASAFNSFLVRNNFLIFCKMTFFMHSS